MKAINKDKWKHTGRHATTMKGKGDDRGAWSSRQTDLLSTNPDRLNTDMKPKHNMKDNMFVKYKHTEPGEKGKAPVHSGLCCQKALSKYLSGEQREKVAKAHKRPSTKHVQRLT